MTQEEVLKNRIVFDATIHQSGDNYNKIITDLLEDSKYIALSILFPYRDFSTMSLPTKYKNWQIRACIELYNLADKISLMSYSENGISWARYSDGLSKYLINELTPRVKTPNPYVAE